MKKVVRVSQGRVLRGKRILVTRPEEKAGELARELRVLGAKPIVLPLTRLSPPTSFRPLDDAIANFDSFDAAVFTSESAVEHFFARVRRRKLQSPRSLYAVGPKTAQALRKQGWRKVRVATERRAEGILKIMGKVRGLRILIPRAEIGREILPETLRARGAIVSVPAVYRALRNPQALAILKKSSGKNFDAVIFASGRAAREFVAAFGRLRSRELFKRAAALSIGPVTSAALRQYGITAVEAPRADTKAIVSELKNYFS